MRLFNRIGPLAVALTAITAVSTAFAQDRQPAELIVVNGKVHTVDEQQPEATAFAVRDGLFVAVGADADMEALQGESTRVIDAGGRTVIPGLNDSHSHSIRGGRFFNLETQHRARMEADEGVRLALKRQDMEPVG